MTWRQSRKTPRLSALFGVWILRGRGPPFQRSTLLRLNSAIRCYEPPVAASFTTQEAMQYLPHISRQSSNHSGLARSPNSLSHSAICSAVPRLISKSTLYAPRVLPSLTCLFSPSILSILHFGHRLPSNSGVRRRQS